jgi:hypothetical protein
MPCTGSPRQSTVSRTGAADASHLLRLVFRRYKQRSYYRRTAPFQPFKAPAPRAPPSLSPLLPNPRCPLNRFLPPAASASASSCPVIDPMETPLSNRRMITRSLAAREWISRVSYSLICNSIPPSHSCTRFLTIVS